MRNDVAPFTDARVRQAIALTLNRTQIVQALFKGFADVGNDSPFAPVFPSTDTSIAQRAQDVAKAKSLLSAAGHPSGFSTQLIANQQLEIPQYASIVQQAAKAIGVNINVKVESPTVYYGKATFGNSDWLDATMSLVDYGHRSVPNVFLTAPLQTINAKAGTGSWNAARFNNSQYDTLSKQYIAAVDLSTQRTIAGQIETLLLPETPIIFGYFYNYLTAQAKNVTGAYPTAIGHIFLYNTVKACPEHLPQPPPDHWPPPASAGGAGRPRSRSGRARMHNGHSHEEVPCRSRTPVARQKQNSLTTAGGLKPRLGRQPERQQEIVAALSGIAPGTGGSPPSQLRAITTALAARRDLWADLVVRDPDVRWYLPLHRSNSCDVWLLAWERGQDTDWHDHGGSSGSFAVAEGSLTEQYRVPAAG